MSIISSTDIGGKNEEENEKKRKKHLAEIIPAVKRNLGKVYIWQPTAIKLSDHHKFKKPITDLIRIRYNLDTTKVAIKINISQNQVIISSINKDAYLGWVKLECRFDTCFATLDYIVPDLKTRQQTVPSYVYGHHQEILAAKNDILSDNEFNNLPEIDNFINDLNEKVKYKASKQAVTAFKKLESNNDNFKNFADLNKQFTDYHLLFNGKINFNSFIKTVSDYWANYNRRNYYNQININGKVNELKIAICRFFNILGQVYGKNNIFKMLQEMELNQQLQEQSSNNYVGMAFSGFCDKKMCNTKIILDTDNFLDVNYAVEVMVHEYGHILDFLITQQQNYRFDGRKFLISTLASGTKINNEAYQKLLTYGIVRSWYGRISYVDLFAEAFGRWILTPQQNRDLGWEKLDKFFTIDLVNLLSSIT